jgi:ubiquitin C-terminal hydrolase
MSDTQMGGIVNMGATCYANAIIQAFRHCRKIPWICEEGRYTTLFKKHPDETRESQQRLFKSFANMIQLLQQCKSNQNVRPADFWGKLHTCVRLHSFGTFEKFIMKMCHDSHEFYLCILDILHEATSQEVEMRITRPPPVSERDKHCVKALTAWKQQFSKTYSPFVDLFYGLYHYVVTCKGCGSESHRWEPFTELKGVPPSEGESATLQSMVEAEFSPVTIADYDCDKCKPKRQEAVQTVSVWRLPFYLVVHLKRFASDGKKIRTRLAPLPLMGEEPVSFSGFFSPFSPELTDKQSYRLISIVDHHGNSNSGHYTAQCRSTVDSTKWNVYDDDSSHPISNPMFGESSYMLWFERS